MDEKIFAYIQDNAPDASKFEIETAFSKHNGDMLETLSELMKIPPKPEATKTAWEERRDICDAYDAEMQKLKST